MSTTASSAAIANAGVGDKETATGAVQEKLLSEALTVVKAQCLHMRRCLDNNRLMDALKHCSAMLAELKTATLNPKGYYELYMAIFDQLRHLALYLYDSHMSARHHLSDLYELVQYAGSIVPRLYLMITVGSVFMRVSRELRASLPAPSLKGKEVALLPADPASASTTGETKPVMNPIHDVPPMKELLKDMLDMTLGVQHPIRGLFLRYYLTSMCRDFMPDGDVDGSPFGSRLDSIQFLLQNFVEMNKLWVRLQYIGHSRERPQRELERRELKLLIGSNLLRLSQIEGLKVETFSQMILPSIMSEVVNCRDVMAQEYLMEVVIQVFPDDFHLHTLDLFLSATSQLSRNVNVKATVMSLVNRFTAFARRAREEHAVRMREVAARGEKLEPISGIPEGVPLFEIFWEQVTLHIAVRPEFELHDVIALLSSLVELSSGCYPTRYDYVDLILGYAKDRVLEVVVAKQPAMANPETSAALLHLLLTTVNAYRATPLVYMQFPSSSLNGGLVTAITPPQPSSTALFAPSVGGSVDAAPVTPPKRVVPSTSVCGNFTDLLRLQSYGARKRVARAFATHCVAASNTLQPKSAVGAAGPPARFRVDSLAAVEAVFGEVAETLVRDEIDGGLSGPRVVRIDDGSVSPERVGTLSGGEDDGPTSGTGRGVVDLERVVGDCGAVARLVSLVGSQGLGSPDDDVQLLSLARRYLREGGDIRLKFSIPPLVFSCVGIARMYLRYTELSDVTIIQRLNNLFQFMNETIHILRDTPPARNERDALTKLRVGLPATPELLMKLHLAVAQSAHECRNEEAAYEAIVNAITTYEENAVETRHQLALMHALIGTLSGISAGLESESYGTLVGRVVVHSGRLLKKADQCRAILVAAHLYWGQERKAGDGTENGVADHPVSEEMLAASRRAVSAAAAAAAASKRSKLSGLFGEEDLAAGEGGSVASPIVAGAEAVEKGFRDGRKVLECLQKSLKIADSVLEVAVNTELFIEILEQYIWFYENGNDVINVTYLNSLIDLIQSNIGSSVIIPANPNNSSNSALSPTTVGGNPTTAGIPERIVKRFNNIVTRLKALRDEEEEDRRQRGLDMHVGAMESGFIGRGGRGAGGRWSQLELI
ncbi:vacuolar protein sorting-associated protein 35 [Chytriomyces sp. MP71]|nr:vacuolar protein sorting-associated protein 35 [Chytriomyces sp. MP71]